MRKPSKNSGHEERTRAFRGRSLSCFVDAIRKGSGPSCPILLTSRPDDPTEFAWTLVTQVRKKTSDERALDKKKSLEVTERLLEAILNEAFIYVGRSFDCDVVLAAKSVSRIHACFSKRENSWVVTDVGSSNGTMVDGRLLTEGHSATLGNLTKISFGPDAGFFFVTPESVKQLAEVSSETSDRIELPSPAEVERMKNSAPEHETASLLTPAPKLESADATLDAAISSIEAMASLLSKVIVTIKNQPVVIYDSTDHDSHAESIRNDIWNARGLVQSVQAIPANGDRSPIQVFAR